MVGFPAPGTSSDSSFLCSYVLCLHLCPYPPPRKGPVGGCALLLSVLPEGTQRVSTFPLVTPCHPPTTRALGLSVSLSHQGSRSGNSSGSLSILGALLCHIFGPLWPHPVPAVAAAALSLCTVAWVPTSPLLISQVL